MINKKTLLLFFAIFILMLQPVSAEIYKWTDSDGEVHFSDSDPWENEAQGEIEHFEAEYEDDEVDTEEEDYSDFGGKAPFEIYAGSHIHAIFSYPEDSKHMRYLSQVIENIKYKIHIDNFKEISKEEFLSHDFFHDGLRQSVSAADEVIAYEGGPDDIGPIYMVLLKKRMPDSNGNEMIRSMAEGYYNYAGLEEIVEEKADAAGDYFHELKLWSIKDRQKIRKLMGKNCYIQEGGSVKRAN